MDGTGIFEMDGIEFLETPVIRNGFPIAADPAGDLLRALLERERAGRKLLTRDTLSWQDGENNRFPPENLNGILLCLAAAAGRTEQVRLLSAWGVAGSAPAAF